MAPVEEQLIQVNMKGSEANLAFPNMLNEQLDSFSGIVQAGDGAPSQQQYEVFKVLRGQLDQQLAAELAHAPRLILVAGRYEGFDERIIEHFSSEQISIGRYVLSGGELAAMVLCDAVIRKLPGSLGDETSAVEESFSPALEGAPEYPHYTRPAEYRGWSVPDVLLSGHHARIREWRLEQARRRESGESKPLR